MKTLKSIWSVIERALDAFYAGLKVVFGVFVIGVIIFSALAGLHRMISVPYEYMESQIELNKITKNNYERLLGK